MDTILNESMTSHQKSDSINQLLEEQSRQISFGSSLK